MQVHRLICGIIVTTFAGCGADHSNFRGEHGLDASTSAQIEDFESTSDETALVGGAANPDNRTNLLSFNGNSSLDNIRPAGVSWDGRVSVMCYFEDHHPGKFCGVRAFNPLMAKQEKSGKLDLTAAFSAESKLIAPNGRAFYYNANAQFRGVTLAQNPLFRGSNGNPYRCNNSEQFDINGLNECYEVMLVSFRSINNDFQNGALLTTTARIVVRTFEMAGSKRQRLNSADIVRAKMHSDWITMQANGRPIPQWEPSITADGRLLLVRLGQYLTNNYQGNSFTAFARSWTAPRDIHLMMNESADFKNRYPVARKTWRDAAGRACNRYPQCGGQYPWISPGGEDIFFNRFGLNVSRGIGLLVIGVSTNYIEQYVDGAPNINRYTWVGPVNALAGLTGSMWFPFTELTSKSIFPFNKSKHLYPLTWNNGYVELDMARYTESYDIYLPMSEMMTFRGVQSSQTTDRYFDGKTWRQVNDSPFSRKLTPDISGNFNTARLNEDAHFPNEYMNLVDRSKSAINQLNGFIGRGIYLAPSGAVVVDVSARDHNDNAENLQALRRGVRGIHTHLAARAVENLSKFESINLAKHGSAWRMSINRFDKFCVSIQPKGKDTQSFCSEATFPLSIKSWNVYGFNINPVSKRLRLFVNGETVGNFEIQNFTELTAEEAPIVIGPAMTQDPSKRAILIVDEFGLSLKARSEEFDQSTAGYFEPKDSIRAATLGNALPAQLAKPANGLSIDDLWLPTAAVNPIRSGQYQKIVELGESLFVDEQLTGKNISCATCHNPKAQFVDTRKDSNGNRVKKSRGVDGKLAERHTPTLVNRGWSTRQMADGSATSLTDQVLMPLVNPNEMGGELSKIIAYLRANDRYSAEFKSIFNRQPTKDDLATVIAVFMAGLSSPASEADDMLGSRVSKDEEGKALRILRGQAIFTGKAGCVGCHSGPNFSDESFHNSGLNFGAQGDLLDIGRARVSRSQRDIGAVKTPSLRAIKSTAPYMAHGQFANLVEVIDFYNRGGRAGPNRSPQMRPLRLTNQEQSLLLDFLRSL